MNEIQLNLEIWSLSPAFVEVFLRGAHAKHMDIMNWLMKRL